MMNTSTAVLEHSVNGATAPAAPATARTPEPLLREALGLTLRAFRADKGVTLRELAGVARVSPGYLSELERGRKEASSELLAAICEALDVELSDMLFDVSESMADASGKARRVDEPVEATPTVTDSAAGRLGGDTRIVIPGPARALAAA